MLTSQIKSVQSSSAIGSSILRHKSGVKFLYSGIEKPQFSSLAFVKLTNLKTNKVESFILDTYLRYFEVVQF